MSNEYRDRVALWLHDNAGNFLVQDDRSKGLGLKFPGGGIDPGQSVNDAAIREALEEVGYAVKGKPSAIPGIRAKKIDWDPVYSAEAAAKGRNFRGSKHYHRMALVGDRDESLLGSEGDALNAKWMPISEVLEITRNAASDPNNKYNYFDEERLRAAQKMYELLSSSDKTAMLRVNTDKPLIRAYLIGQKLATADFSNDNAIDDSTNDYDNVVNQKVTADQFVSSEDHGNKTPSTNDKTWIGNTTEAIPDSTDNNNYKRDKLERT